MPISFRKSRGTLFGILLASNMVLAGCQALPDVPNIKIPPVLDRPSQPNQPSQPIPTPTPPIIRTPMTLGSLEQEIKARWRVFPGKTGVAVHKIGSDWTVGTRLNDMFPQQSVSKLWVAIAILDQIDLGQMSLNTPVRVGYADFTMFQSDIKARVERDGPVTTTIAELMELAILKSDNTANDKLASLIGGPEAVRRMLSAKNLSGIRFGPGERKMQSDIAGFPWDQSYGPGNRWFEARAKISEATRRSGLNAYLANPVDGATPAGMSQALGRLARGDLLSAQSTRHLLGLMARVTSGPKRLKAGVPAGWSFGHKTGTGQVLSPIATGYNDVGIMTAPDGTQYAVTVLLSDTTASVPERMEFMQSISRLVGAYHSGQ